MKIRSNSICLLVILTMLAALLLNGTMLADLKTTQISDAEVSSAINKLLENQEYLQISKIGNTVHFLQWHGIRDIGCGIAYTINGTDFPEVEFLTELIPLSEDGWFYYVSDYNSWRNGETMS